MNGKRDEHELVDLAKAWGAISLAFAIAMSGGRPGADFAAGFAIAAFTVGVGFVFHELSHKFTAQSFGVRAGFESFDQMLVLAILMSFAGFILAAPGAVMIRGQVTKRQNGIISAAGIGANLLAAVVFLGLGAVAAGGILGRIAAYGVLINSWLALFNLIPFGGFDGAKIFAWNKVVWGLMGVAALFFMAG